MQIDQAILDEMERKLCVIADFIEDDEVRCEVYPASEEFELPTLLLEPPHGDAELPRVTLMNFVPMPEGGEYTDYIQFYLEFPSEVSGFDELELLKAIDGLNRQLPLGHCVTVAPGPDQGDKVRIGMRYMYALSNERDIDDGNLLEALMLFLLSSDAVGARLFGE